MLLLVLAGNFVFLIVGWAMVGLSSYFLIGFWYQRRSAVLAARKAFVMNVIGDVGMILGAFVLFVTYHAITYAGVFAALQRAACQPDCLLGSSRRRQPDSRARRLPAPGRRGRQVRTAPAPHLAARRHGGPDAGQRADPRRDDGHRRRLPGRPHAPDLRRRRSTRTARSRSSAPSPRSSRPRSRSSRPTSSACSPTRR